ncbi:hypothetical protein [Streptomyces sp. Wh19]|uniref:Uncharacterized protein n=1 Tax=Streptomyces sanglieri TaxID=193460 RepID=A0ABW2WTI6_9ACTN|nr:hypothetical protein [Streptomyces sp. Wh19]MDV9196886.1 hypothetical protein [Streptomyces sp. Wh19]
MDAVEVELPETPSYDVELIAEERLHTVPSPEGSTAGSPSVSRSSGH